LKLKRYTFVIVPEDRGRSRKISMSTNAMRCIFAILFGATVMLGYWAYDYVELREMRTQYMETLQESRAMRGEAKILMSNLEDVKTSLQKVKEYTSKLSEITNLQTNSISRRTGINAIKPGAADQAAPRNFAAELITKSTQQVPSGIAFESLIFKPVFQRLNSIGMQASVSAFDLQSMIASLSQQKTLLSSVPSLNPVDGWVTSGFGARMSPFTGESAYHKGIDVAAPVGTPVMAPADGVVVFSGRKEGFGNFVMVAHGFGVVTGYGHNAQNLVTNGQVIKRGEQLATVGQTGRTTGPHLHYEIWVNGRVVDPKKFILNSDEYVLAAH
jgi:murein DD-endopeptidase MepM/ murein hydrolase activator NlpD